ncbi:MAG: ABC transporter permease subunit [Proteobacteria bacterium]|nr:ABC transporter permease subunit [Pseudomonadota bacterium]
MSVRNFLKAFEPLHLEVLLSTFEISISVAAICLMIAYPMALFICAQTKKVGGILLALVVIPFFTSLLVRNYAWLFLLGSKGVINSTLLKLGFISEPLPLMFNRFGVIVGMTHVLLPYLVLVLLDVLRGIDGRLSQAAASLGSGPFSAFRRVTFPLSRAGAGSGFVLVSVIALGFFVTPAMLGSPQDAMIANDIASEIGFLNWGFAAAQGILLLVITLVVIVIMQKAFGGLSMIAPSLKPDKPIVVRGQVSAPHSWLQWLDPILDPLWPFIITVAGILGLAFLFLPILIVFPLSFSSAQYFVFPPPGWSAKWYFAFIENRQWTDAFANSIVIALTTVVLTLAMAVPAALGIARSRSRFVVGAYLLIVSPLIVPTIITAISVFFAFTKAGLGRTTLGIALGHSIGALPLAVVVLVSAFTAFDWTLERAALSLGMTRIKAMFKVVLPILTGAVATAAFLAFLHSFDDLLIALFLGGISLETLPRRMWESLQEINPTIAAVSTLLVVLMTVLLSVVQLLQRRQEQRRLARE